MLELSFARVFDDEFGELECGYEGEGSWDEECVWVLEL